MSWALDRGYWCLYLVCLFLLLLSSVSPVLESQIRGRGSGSNPVEPVSNVAYRPAGRQRSRIQVYPNIRGSLLVTLETGRAACSYGYST
jgi:hypothetical protein